MIAQVSPYPSPSLLPWFLKASHVISHPLCCDFDLLGRRFLSLLYEPVKHDKLSLRCRKIEQPMLDLLVLDPYLPNLPNHMRDMRLLDVRAVLFEQVEDPGESSLRLDGLVSEPCLRWTRALSGCVERHLPRAFPAARFRRSHCNSKVTSCQRLCQPWQVRHYQARQKPRAKLVLPRAQHIVSSSAWAGPRPISSDYAAFGTSPLGRARIVEQLRVPVHPPAKSPHIDRRRVGE